MNQFPRLRRNDAAILTTHAVYQLFHSVGSAWIRRPPHHPSVWVSPVGAEGQQERWARAVWQLHFLSEAQNKQSKTNTLLPTCLQVLPSVALFWPTVLTHCSDPLFWPTVNRVLGDPIATALNTTDASAARVEGIKRSRTFTSRSFSNRVVRGIVSAWFRLSGEPEPTEQHTADLN